MSATLADYAILVRELDCSSSVALTPIVDGSEVGFGDEWFWHHHYWTKHSTAPGYRGSL